MKVQKYLARNKSWVSKWWSIHDGKTTSLSMPRALLFPEPGNIFHGLFML
jgi:hypothetical protein